MSANATTEFGNELPIGYRLEEFEIKSVLGSGGFGITYLAWDIDLKRDVVVKENLPFQCAVRDSTRSVRPRTSASGDKDQFEWALNSFMREAETLSQFDHPNIVRVLRRFEANNTAYFIMPYLPGKSLKQVIEDQVQKQQAFTEPKLKELLYPLLDALEVLHAVGVYHRDIKAANVMLVTGHRPILIDFGAARQFISEKSHTIVESAGYTPFEQLQSHGNVGPWSDLYALAATFYTAIHGEAPPRASDRIRRDPIVKLATHYSDVYSQSFMEALDWALAVDETERPQSVAQWREALNGVATPKAVPPPVPKKTDSGQTTVVKPKPAPAPAPVPQPSQPFPWGFVLKIAGGGAVALLLIALVVHFSGSFFAKPGSLHVTSVPPNATVHIDGQTDQKTPAQFPSIRVGKHDVTVSAPGYDPVTINVDIKEAAAFPLDTVQLKRAMGGMSLTTVPPHALFKFESPDDPSVKTISGVAPANFNNIPSGNYRLTLTAVGLGSHSVQVEIPEHKTAAVTEDLVKLSASQDANSPAGKALLGQIPATQLDDGGKKEYSELLTRTMNAYIRYNMFPQAQEQITAMKQIGEDTQDEEKRVAQARDNFERTTTDQIKDLVSDKKFGAANSRIKALGETLGVETLGRFTAKFQDDLSAYQQQATDAIKQAQAAGPAAGYDLLKPFADRHPDDVNVQLALGDMLRQMPPDHDRLGARVTAFKNFDTRVLGMEESAKFQDMQSHLVTEYNTYNDLANKLNRSKNGPAAISRRISQLENQIAENQRKISGGDGVNQAVNTVAGLFGQHVNVNVMSTADRRAAIAREQAELDQCRAALANPSNDASGAQGDFDDFCARVPW